jgi:hypothetical protein
MRYYFLSQENSISRVEQLLTCVEAIQKSDDRRAENFVSLGYESSCDQRNR